MGGCVGIVAGCLPSSQRCLHVPTTCHPVPASPPQVRKGFSQRRKVVRNALRPMHEPAEVAAALAEGGLSVDARAQDLTLQQFVDLAWRLEGGQRQAEEEALLALAQLEADRLQQ